MMCDIKHVSLAIIVRGLIAWYVATGPNMFPSLAFLHACGATAASHSAAPWPAASVSPGLLAHDLAPLGSHVHSRAYGSRQRKHDNMGPSSGNMTTCAMSGPTCFNAAGMRWLNSLLRCLTVTPSVLACLPPRPEAELMPLPFASLRLWMTASRQTPHLHRTAVCRQVDTSLDLTLVPAI